jgi:hypothetical protein
MSELTAKQLKADLILLTLSNGCPRCPGDRMD